MAADAAPALILGNAADKYTYDGKLRKLDEIWDNTDIKKEDFVSSYLDSLSTDDGLYGVPFQISSYVMYWNKDLFEKAGLDPETPPATYDEWTEMAQKLTDPDSHVYGSGLSYTNVGADACINHADAHQHAHAHLRQQLPRHGKRRRHAQTLDREVQHEAALRELQIAQHGGNHDARRVVDGAHASRLQEATGDEDEPCRMQSARTPFTACLVRRVLPHAHTHVLRSLSQTLTSLLHS